MKRRFLIKNGALAAAAAPIALAPGRLYGQPKSVAPADISDELKFILPLSRFGMPDDLLQMSAAVVDLWTDVLSSPANQAAFASDPGPYLARFGLDASAPVIDDSNVKLLTAISTPGVQQALENHDYSSVFTQMEALGAFVPTTPNAFQTVVQNRIAAQKTNLLAYIAQEAGQTDTTANAALAESFVAHGVTATPDDLASLDLVFRDGLGLNPLGMVANVNLVVQANVVVTGLVVVQIGVAVLTAVAVFAFAFVGGCETTGDNKVAPACFESDGDSVTGAKLGTLALSDPTMFKNAERAMRLANLTGNPAIAAHSARQMIATEIAAVITALNNIGVLSFLPNKMPGVIAAVTDYAFKSTGLATAQAG